MKIYFAGSIRGGRNDADKYNKIIKMLQSYGEVITEHIGMKGLSEFGEEDKTEEFIYRRDIDWLTTADVIIADVTVPSLGVGLEIEKAVELNKKLLCLYEKQDGKKLSAMIMGCPEIEVFEYNNLNEVEDKLDKFLIRKDAE